MIIELELWLVFFFPLGSFAVIALVIRPFLNRYAQLAAYTTIFSIAVSLVLSIRAFQSIVDRSVNQQTMHSWLKIGDLDITIGVILDPLTAIMLVVVTSVSLVIQVYSIGYMRGDPGFARYFAYMSLFTASMIGLVIAANVVQMYVFWELVGVSSYLLIGFWYHRPAAAAAAKKAFIVTRIGDFGFLLAILYIFFNADAIVGAVELEGVARNALEIDAINDAAKAGLLATSVVTWIALGIFMGAVGKSGQFPLHTWLPDAMEGPTPVSALIHAATMVAAGVFLVARFFPLFEASTTAMSVVALVGGFTALFAATMALAANDIKRVLAYSTISQLGYMMLALGTGAYGPAVFHLLTHAFFKALLFLGAGSVNHATGTYDMRYMGGLRKVMPWTYATFLVGGLSLAGIFPLAGFWSKDEILAHAWAQDGGVSSLVFWLAAAAVLMTAFYVTRVIVMTFEGEFRGGAEADPEAAPHDGDVHLGESPRVMVGPLVVLAAASVLAGLFVNPPFDLGIVSKHSLSEFLGAEAMGFNVALAALTLAAALAVIGVAYVIYASDPEWARQSGRRLRPAHTLLSRKYYFDEAYEGIVVTRVLYGWLARALDWGDKAIVDGVVRDVDRLGRNVGRGIAQAQTGQLQGYGVAISVGVLGILGIYLIFR